MKLIIKKKVNDMYYLTTTYYYLLFLNESDMKYKINVFAYLYI